VIHLYAFARKLPALPTATGLADTPLERVDVGGIAAIFTTHGHDELEPSRDLALVHGRVITLLDTHAHDVLPVRFGERFGDVEQLRAAVGERRLELEASFARVSGCVEVGLRLLDERRAEPRPASTGTEYMRALQASSGQPRCRGCTPSPRGAVARGAGQFAARRVLLRVVPGAPEPSCRGSAGGRAVDGGAS